MPCRVSPELPPSSPIELAERSVGFPPRVRRLLLIGIDIVLLPMSVWLSFWLRLARRNQKLSHTDIGNRTMSMPISSKRRTLGGKPTDRSASSIGLDGGNSGETRHGITLPCHDIISAMQRQKALPHADPWISVWQCLLPLHRRDDVVTGQSDAVSSFP